MGYNIQNLKIIASHYQNNLVQYITLFKQKILTINNTEKLIHRKQQNHRPIPNTHVQAKAYQVEKIDFNDRGNVSFSCRTSK